jgi:orotate phosphoribosyltransferase
MSEAMVDYLNVFDLFKERGALLEGHFILSSGLHSDRYMQSAVLLQDPVVAEKLGQSLAEKFPGDVDAVLSPAIGGLIIGHEVARAKGCRAIFSEKDDAGKPVLRRSFEIQPGEKILVIEDVITTGLSTGEVAGLVTQAKGNIVGVGSIVNRSGKKPGTLFNFSAPVHSLLELDVKTWPPADCALCKQGSPAVKPGSRKKTQ